MCICLSPLVLKWFKSSCKTTSASPMVCLHKVGWSASIVHHIPSFAGFQQSLQPGLEIIMGQELGIPPMHSQKWTAGELNAILLHNLVPTSGGAGQLRTFDNQNSLIPKLPV